MPKCPPPPGDDDPQAFRRAMADVRPLAAKATVATRPQPRAVARFTRARRETQAMEGQPGRSPAVHDAGGRLQFRRPGVGEEVMRKLARGQFPVEAEADLHGMRLHPAQDALREFIGDCVVRRLRCVRIIHGKGLRSGPDGPVLKIAVSHWLRNYDAVAAYTSARPDDGGSGAVYVLLR
jgi:DNA-nicking Smr family endonuclease